MSRPSLPRADSVRSVVQSIGLTTKRWALEAKETKHRIRASLEITRPKHLGNTQEPSQVNNEASLSQVSSPIDSAEDYVLVENETSLVENRSNPEESVISHTPIYLTTTVSSYLNSPMSDSHNLTAESVSISRRSFDASLVRSLASTSRYGRLLDILRVTATPSPPRNQSVYLKRTMDAAVQTDLCPPTCSDDPVASSLILAQSADFPQSDSLESYLSSLTVCMDPVESNAPSPIYMPNARDPTPDSHLYSTISLPSSFLHSDGSSVIISHGVAITCSSSEFHQRSQGMILADLLGLDDQDDHSLALTQQPLTPRRIDKLLDELELTLESPGLGLHCEGYLPNSSELDYTTVFDGSNPFVLHSSASESVIMDPRFDDQGQNVSTSLELSASFSMPALKAKSEHSVRETPESESLSSPSVRLLERLFGTELPKSRKFPVVKHSSPGLASFLASKGTSNGSNLMEGSLDIPDLGLTLTSVANRSDAVESPPWLIARHVKDNDLIKNEELSIGSSGNWATPAANTVTVLSTRSESSYSQESPLSELPQTAHDWILRRCPWLGSESDRDGSPLAQGEFVTDGDVADGDAEVGTPLYDIAEADECAESDCSSVF